MIDTHCHLTYEPLLGKINEVLERAKADGVLGIIVPGTGLLNSQTTVDVSKNYANVWAGVGIHPCEAYKEKKGWVKELEDLIKKERQSIVMIGEVGLDYYHFEDCQSELDKSKRIQVQKTAFLQQICLARKYKLPLCIHSRMAFSDTYRILREEAQGVSTVIHCFSGTYDEAKQWLAMGYMLSLTGMITYKKNDQLREMVKAIPMDRIMVETDAPFLPPEGFRGEICEPRFVKEVVSCIAQCKGLTFAEVERITTDNAIRFFSISPEPI